MNSELAKEIKALGYLIMFALTHVLTKPLRSIQQHLFALLKFFVESVRIVDLNVFDVEHLINAPPNPTRVLNQLVGEDVIVISRHHERICAAKLQSWRYMPSGRIVISYIDYTSREREVICQDIAYFTVTPYDESLLLSFKEVEHGLRHRLAPKEVSVHWEDFDDHANHAVKRTRVSPCSQYLPTASIDGVIDIMRRRAESAPLKNIPRT